MEECGMYSLLLPSLHPTTRRPLAQILLCRGPWRKLSMGEDCPTAVLQCDSAASRESVVLFVTPGCFQARATPARSGSSLALRRGRGGGFCGVAAPRFLVPRCRPMPLTRLVQSLASRVSACGDAAMLRRTRRPGDGARRDLTRQ